MKDVMLAYDHEIVESQNEEMYLIEQLSVENAHLRGLLRVQEGDDMLEIAQKIK